MEQNGQYYQELAQKIETGEYFNEARDWYVKTYIQNFIERTYLIILVFLLFIAGFLILAFYQEILPIKKDLPIKVSISNTADFSTRITYLGNKEKNFNINEIMIKFLSRRFVDAIESYDFRNDFKKLRLNKNIIETLASEDILAYYLDKISIRNRDSILLKYKKNIIREIKIDPKIEIALLSADNNSLIDENDHESADKKNDIIKYQISTNFDANEIDKGGTVTKSKWNSKIILSFQTIKYNFKDKEYSPLNYKVLSYESKKIN